MRQVGCLIMHAILQKLDGTDRRSIGRANEVVNEVLAEPRLFSIVFDGMLHANPVVRMRCADAVEKITRQHPEYLLPYKKKLIRQVAKVEQQEVRWHVAQLFSRLALSRNERRQVHGVLSGFLSDDSKIVRTFAMQALSDIAERDAELRILIIKRLEELTRTGSPAMRSRGRRLLTKLTRK
jgi:hypothetical protein